MILTSKSRASIETLQIGRAFAAIAVVLYHTEVTLGLDKYIGREIFPIFRSGDSGVFYFFALSGFVMVTAHGDDFGRQDVVLPFLWKRFRRLYPTLWVVLITQLLLFAILPQERIPMAELPWTTLKDFLILPWHGPSLLPVEWTLRHEVLFYLVFACALAAPQATWLIAVALLSAIATGLIFTIPEPIDRLFSGYNLLFGFGIVAAILYRRGAFVSPVWLLLIGFLIFFATWIALALGQYSKNIVSIWTYGAGAALIIGAAATIERQRELRAPSIALILGDASYSIYLVHYPIVVLTSKVICRMHPNSTFEDAAAFVAVAILATAAGLVFHLGIEKPLLKFLPQRVRSPVQPASAGVRSRST
ncbi:acyltransferase [Bradyrhizobium sp. 4]|uniref:acyltransferase family protein n=1 Tax=unclassified Bradyrhizobium TaxID=2631580 RepID=UPI001FF93BF2|nr:MULTISPECIES: acyltransferase [unclassified Bradyrhizobium]MCK1397443.1 acyltransferase [Bradyrhizobium sp. 39]MCK1752518.1 acyltransferase [Bradyrhizobium sp. 135]UPJ36737.1 acyltransferase [Bradyrhizobium sp. 4]